MEVEIKFLTIKYKCLLYFLIWLKNTVNNAEEMGQGLELVNAEK